VLADDYMDQFEGHYEWVRGYVIKMAPISLGHDKIVGYLRELLRAYFALKPIGTVVGDPFVMRLDATESRRQPDLQIILDSNPGELTETAMHGPADIVIEVASPGSVSIDYGEKFAEYEKGGVREYWLIDPIRNTCRFNRLTDKGVYGDSPVGEDGIYTTLLLPGLRLHIPTLWQETLPDLISVVQSVRDMLDEPE
jgi:Uma2 family endonuclease